MVIEFSRIPTWQKVSVVGMVIVVTALVLVAVNVGGSAPFARVPVVPTILLAAVLVGALLGGYFLPRASGAPATTASISRRSGVPDTAALDRQPTMALITMIFVIAAGLVVAFWYGLAMQGGGLSTALLLIGIIAASTLVGSFIGFLFGIPRFDFTSPATAPAAASTPSASAGSTPQTPGRRYRPSTNLDEIADWLTKIIAGLGLTQLDRLGTHLMSLTRSVLSSCQPSCPNEGFVASGIVYGAVSGFLYCYVWTRLYYPKMAARSDKETEQTLRHEEAKAVAEMGIGKDSKAPTQATVTQAPAVAASSADPNKNKFGGSAVANGRVLRATIQPSESQAGLYRISLTVTSTVNTNPLMGFVVFHIHPTFRQHEVTRPVENGVASLTLVAWGAFTVGAVADNGATRLELDLANHPDATADFKSK